MKRWGRRLTFCIVAILGIIGTVVQGLSTIPASYAILVVGKVVIGMSIGVATGSVGVYLAECSPAQIRGMIANFYGAVSVSMI
jgi:MFS family permease